MKTILALITMSIIFFTSIYSQSVISDKYFLVEVSKNFPDSLILKKESPDQPCYVKSVNEDSFELCYQYNEFTKVNCLQLKEMIIGGLGTIYTASSGFLVNQDKLNEYLVKRHKKIAAGYENIILEKKQKEEALEKGIAELEKPGKDITKKDLIVSVESEIKPQTKCSNGSRWSFGFNYIPYNSATIYTFNQTGIPTNGFSLNTYSVKETKMEGEFSYLIAPKLRVTSNIGYMTSIKDNNYEEHFRSTGNSTSEFGYRDENKTKLLWIEIGVKYYLVELFNLKSSAYVFAGFGKQFAFVSKNYEELFVNNPPQYTQESNMNDYLEKLNSPYKLNLGFGAEYFFNESLSLKSFIRLFYYKNTADYDYRIYEPISERTSTTHFEQSETSTEIGVGLNFYF